jgi:hypothetical protein
MPALSAKDVAAAVVYAISVKDNVQVSSSSVKASSILIIFFADPRDCHQTGRRVLMKASRHNPKND